MESFEGGNPFAGLTDNLPMGRSPHSAEQGGRVPPHNLEAERSILGAVLVNNESLDRVREIGLEPRDFYRDAHQKMVGMRRLAAKRL
jgi:replicative DNA helicase